MLKNSLLYLIGVIVLGFAVGLGLSLLFKLLPFFIVVLLWIVPIYGTIRKKCIENKKWISESLGIKKYVLKGCKYLSSRKSNYTLYAVLGIGILVIHDEIAVFLVESLSYLFCVGAIVFIVWESIRVVLKKINIPSFIEAIRSVW